MVYTLSYKGPLASIQLQMAMEELGPTFVKSGKISLCVRRSFESTAELAKLKSDADPMPFRIVTQNP